MSGMCYVAGKLENRMSVGSRGRAQSARIVIGFPSGVVTFDNYDAHRKRYQDASILLFRIDLRD